MPDIVTWLPVLLTASSSSTQGKLLKSVDNCSVACGSIFGTWDLESVTWTTDLPTLILFYKQRFISNAKYEKTSWTVAYL